jgi:glycosyltransferase involved in cell wall biosynthesis
MQTVKGPPSLVRVAHVTLGLDMGGLEKLLVEFARHADPSRFRLCFISLTTRGRLAKDIEAFGWPVTALEEPEGLRPGLVLRLARLFRRWRVEVIHTHDDKPLLYASLAGRLARVPRHIHTKHGQSYTITRRQIALVNLAARLTDRFVCVSRDSARLTVHQGVSPRRVSAIWNGIDLGRFAFSGATPGGPVVTVARLNPEKDIENLFRAAALAVREEPGLRLEIAGDGPCLPALKRTAAELDLEDKVRFLGEVREVPALLARASVFVLPSLSEGVSLTLLEAMARGLPVVATRVGGNPEVVVDGETGLLVPARDPAALAAGVLRLFRDPGEGRRMGAAGRMRVETHFDVRRMAARYEALYLERKYVSHP